MIQLTLERLDLQNPTWSATPLKPGVAVTLDVQAPSLVAPQFIRYEILRAAEVIDTVESVAGKTAAKWTPPNLPGTNTLTFRASLADTPTPVNGQTAIVVGINSPNATLQGFEVVKDTIDEAFVPKQENLQLAYTITDAGGAALKGRYEVWGERYPGDTPAPLYTEDFTPVVGATTWSSWSGKANAGKLSGKYITPEFSPYKVRIVIGPDSASVKDPEGAGQSKVSVAETSFEISVLCVLIRIQEGIKESAKLKEHKLEEALLIEPRQPNGDFADTGRLPKPAWTGVGPRLVETARIRIPMCRHMARAEGLGQGGPGVGDAYQGAGAVKFDIDQGYYTRPELPIEFEPHLKSRDNTVNTDPDRQGLFEKEAIGPLKIEPIAEDFYDDARYSGLYIKNASFKVKRGTDTAPYHDPATNRPEFECWQARIEVTVDGAQDFNITTFNATPDCGYTAGSDELKVYLNRAPLERSDTGDDTELNNGQKDYREVAAVPAVSIRLAPHLTKAGDVLWVLRSSGAAVDWPQFPPGPNCHKHYGGIRGKKPAADIGYCLRKEFSPNPAGRLDPIIGKSSGSYRYKLYINLRPELQMDQDKQERVEISALTSGSKQGLAGVLFSPSFIAGDSYVLKAWVEHQPYERNLGFIQRTPKIVESKTGILNIWRRPQFEKSMRMPQVGTGGLGAGVGMGADALAPYRGDGINMGISAMNGQYADAYNEWTIPDRAPVHQPVPLEKYRKAHNLYSNGLAGKVPLKNNGQVQNHMAQYDYYREFLPPGVAFPNLAANHIATEPKGTLSQTVGNNLVGALVGVVADPLINGGVTAIAVYGGTADDYFFAAMGRWDTIVHGIVDVLTPRKAEPRKMNVVRWEFLHENNFWNDFTGGVVGTNGLTWEGESMGDGNSIFLAGNISATLFAHEMAHSIHTAHFVGMDFNWKHHDLNTPTCLMSYNFTEHWIWRPGGAVGPTGGGTDAEHGWPDNDINPGSGLAEDCIHYGPGIVMAGLCAKCRLKLRGWDERKLPAAWAHPDLF